MQLLQEQGYISGEELTGSKLFLFKAHTETVASVCYLCEFTGSHFLKVRFT